MTPDEIRKHCITDKSPEWFLQEIAAQLAELNQTQQEHSRQLDKISAFFEYRAEDEDEFE